MNEPIRNDCIRFRGDKPCLRKRLCGGCPDYESFSDMTRILILKCRAQGDVLRTTALLPGIKRKYPRSFITWLVDAESVDLLEENPLIDRIVPFDLEGTLFLSAQRFDVLIGLDKEPGIIALASRLRAEHKFGFGMNEHGNLQAFNAAADYALRLGIDDGLKYGTNRRTYQEIAAEASEIGYWRDEYILVLPAEARRRADAFFTEHGIPGGRPNIGLNTGSGTKFLTKQWPESFYRRLAVLLRERLNANIFLLGGSRETEINRSLEKLPGKGIYNTGNGNSLLEFAAFIDRLDAVVSSDTLGLHIAIALKKKAVALFGPTCPQEIDLYDRGTKLFLGKPCSPCYRKTCPDAVCMNGITPEAVFREIEKIA
jgi:ADP-heptose:LPS heptosyltransferase